MNLGGTGVKKHGSSIASCRGGRYRRLVTVIFLALLFSTVPLELHANTVNTISYGEIAVGPNVQVSKRWRDREHEETILAADPNDANRLLGSSMALDAVTSTYYVLVYLSVDGGRTWEPTLEVRLGPLAGDPTIAFGPKGLAYFACIGFPPKPDSRPGAEMRAYRSPDGGKTWGPPTILPMSDREYLVVDNTGGKYNGRVYLHGLGGPQLNQNFTAFNGGEVASTMEVYRSLDGVGFPEPLRLAFKEDRPLRRLGNSVVLSDGTFIAVVGEGMAREEGSSGPPMRATKPTMAVKVVSSSDGGETFSPATTVSSWYYPAFQGWATNPSIDVDASRGPFRDRVYVAWADERSGRSTILLCYSDNKGKTWSAPVTVNDDQRRPAPAEGPDAFQPAVAVNKNGIVGVVWYDRRDHANNLSWSEYFAASLDGGETFTPNVRVSEQPFIHDLTKSSTVQTILNPFNAGGNPNGQSGTLSFSVFAGRAYAGAGETQGLAASADGAFHPLWIDNRTGIPQVWTARVIVSGQALRNGSALLDGLTDVTRDVAMEITNPKFDSTTRTVSLQASLINTSSTRIAGPLKVRVLSVSSRLGTVEVTDGGGELRQGAVWDFGDQMPSGGLEPGKMTSPRRLEFRIGKLSGTEEALWFPTFVNVRAKIFGRR